MRHAIASLTALALAAGMLAWPGGPLHANGLVETNNQFVNHPDVQLFTPTPRERDADEPKVAPPPPVVVNVVVDARTLDRAYYAGLVGDVRKKRAHRLVRHGRGFRADWSSRGFRADWSFGTGRGFHAGKSLRGGRGLGARKSFRGGRGFGAGRSFRMGRAGFGGGHGRR